MRSASPPEFAKTLTAEWMPLCASNKNGNGTGTGEIPEPALAIVGKFLPTLQSTRREAYTFSPPPLFLHPQPTTFFLRLSFTRTGGETFSSDGKKSVRLLSTVNRTKNGTALMLISSTSFWLSLVQKDPARTCSSWSSSCSGSNDHSRQTTSLRRSSVPSSSSEELATRPSVRAMP